MESLITIFCPLLFSPLLLGVINRTKARFVGRRGAPLLQPYFDLWKYMNKGSVYSKTTTWIFRASPGVLLLTSLVGLFILPFGHVGSTFFFGGDFLVLIYLLALGRFFMVSAALDTGSSFEGMGASREVFFALFSEVALLFALGALAWKTTQLSLTPLLSSISLSFWQGSPSLLLLISISLFLVFLAENARLPVDDPNTHLELTMIHEVLILDHSGVDLAILQYSSALKHWILGSLFLGVWLPVHFKNPWAETVLCLGGLFFLGVLVGIVESTMARLRLLHVPRLLVGAAVLSLFAFLFGLK